MARRTKLRPNEQRRYVIVASGVGRSAGVAEDVERALSTPGVTGKVTDRFPWGVAVRATAAFEDLVRRSFPSLEISEEANLHLT
jgi:hypothetical protein